MKHATESKTETKDIKKTIHYVYEDGTYAAEDKVDTVIFTRTVMTNEATVDEVTGLTATVQDSGVTVTYSPQLETTTENKKLNQTIHYVYEDGKKAADDKVDTVMFTRTAHTNELTVDVNLHRLGSDR